MKLTAFVVRYHNCFILLCIVPLQETLFSRRRSKQIEIGTKQVRSTAAQTNFTVFYRRESWLIFVILNVLPRSYWNYMFINNSRVLFFNHKFWLQAEVNDAKSCYNFRYKIWKHFWNKITIGWTYDSCYIHHTYHMIMNSIVSSPYNSALKACLHGRRITV